MQNALQFLALKKQKNFELLKAQSSLISLDRLLSLNSMTTKKRSLDNKTGSGPQRKKAKVSPLGETPEAVEQKQTTSFSNIDDEVDFPRGGGSSFTPLEYKIIRAEAIKEADQDLLFKVCHL